MKLALLLLLMLFSALAQAQIKKHPIDIAYEKCVAAYQKDPDFLGEPGPMRGCQATALRQWNAEMTRLLAKLPSQRAAQTAWVHQRDKHVAELKADARAATDAKSDADLPMTVFDDVRDYQISVTRLRVLSLSKTAGNQLFSIPKD